MRILLWQVKIGKNFKSGERSLILPYIDKERSPSPEPTIATNSSNSNITNDISHEPVLQAPEIAIIKNEETPVAAVAASLPTITATTTITSPKEPLPTTTAVAEAVSVETETVVVEPAPKMHMELDNDTMSSRLGVDSEEEGEVKSIKSQSPPPPPESPKELNEHAVQETTIPTDHLERPQQVEEALEDGEIAE